MVRNIIVIGLSSHPSLITTICTHLGVQPASVILGKFKNGETRVEIQQSVRGSDVYIVQSSGSHVNDYFMELAIAVSACKGASANRVTAVLPLFPYSRQTDSSNRFNGGASKARNPLDSVPSTPHPDRLPSKGLQSNGVDHEKKVHFPFEMNGTAGGGGGGGGGGGSNGHANGITRSSRSNTAESLFELQPGYNPWTAHSGTLIADLLTCAGADHIITMDLHDPQYQGFFDIPVDNLYGRPLLQKYIVNHIPDYQNCIIVSPDAGGAKRATAVADRLTMPFALIHSERRHTKFSEQQNASMMLVGDVKDRICILIDDLVDTGKTLSRAARLLKREGAQKVIALVTHGQFSQESIPRMLRSAIDKLVVTNTLPQHVNQRLCPKLEVLEVGAVFAEAIRRVHHGESLSVLFQYD